MNQLESEPYISLALGFWSIGLLSQDNTSNPALRSAFITQKASSIRMGLLQLYLLLRRNRFALPFSAGRTSISTIFAVTMLENSLCIRDSKLLLSNPIYFSLSPMSVISQHPPGQCRQTLGISCRGTRSAACRWASKDRGHHKEPPQSAKLP